ncbi:MAG: HU family DNA-binding protein [Paludibacteraceae bacterium]|nr:HU family DNA-binding protein [Paludibacteraceae bacterium]MBO7259575.1 HU family DNA-binding protein [Paludibacteraceae bacterium]
MNSKEFTQSLMHATSLKKDVVEMCTLQLTNILTSHLCDGESVSIQGFGTFEVRKKNERISVHPKTQERTLIPPKLTMNFKQSSTLKDKLTKKGDEL